MGKFGRHQLGNSGLLLVEILLAVAIMGTITLFILSAFMYGQEGTTIAGDRSRATAVAQTCIEAIHNMAQDSYANLSTYSNGTTYYLDISGTQWMLTTDETTIDGLYTPAVEFSDGPNGSRQATVTVSWPINSSRTGSVTITTYFTDWQSIALALPATSVSSVRFAA